MKTIDIKTAKTAELVSFYNEHSGNPAIKKFSDRATAEKRVGDLLATMNPVVAKKPASKTKSLSASIAASWKDPKVAKARSSRTHVKIGTTVYRSVKDAFEQLGLPLSKHIKFRMELKQHAQLTFKHEGKSITFHITQGE